MRLRSKTASILSEHFSPKSQRRYYQMPVRPILKHIIGRSEKRSTPAPETVSLRKNNFPSPPVPPLGLLQSFVGLVFLGSIFILLLALTAVSISFIYLNNFLTNRPVITQLLKMSLSMWKVWASILRPVEYDTL